MESLCISTALFSGDGLQGGATGQSGRSSLELIASLHGTVKQLLWVDGGQYNHMPLTEVGGGSRSHSSGPKGSPWN